MAPTLFLTALDPRRFFALIGWASRVRGRTRFYTCLDIALSQTMSELPIARLVGSTFARAGVYAEANRHCD